jgi:xanthine dehydrogenase YagT iron-sulfur-binding subunit
MDIEISLRVDGSEHRLATDPRTTLLDVLRERFGVTTPRRIATMGSAEPARFS